MSARRLRLLTTDVTAALIVVIALGGFILYWFGLVAIGDGSPLMLEFVAWYMALTFLPRRRRR